MRRQQLGRTGFIVSPVVYGGIIHMREEQAQANRYVAYAVESGVNYFDVAPSYEDAQALMGPALAPFRKDVYLACKTMERTREGARSELLQSLKDLRTDYLDVYQFHALTTQEDIDTLFGPDGAMETFLWAKKEGLIRNIGFSTHNERIAMKALKQFDFDTVLFPMNWAMGVTTGWGDQVSAHVEKTDAGLLAMKTLIHRKWLPDEERIYEKSWSKPIEGNDRLAVAAMKYGLSKGADTLIPPGDFKHFNFMLDHIEECLDHPLSEEERAMLQEEGDQVKDHLIFAV